MAYSVYAGVNGPLMANSILHGFKQMEDGGYIYISVEQEKGFLRRAEPGLRMLYRMCLAACSCTMVRLQVKGMGATFSVGNLLIFI
ncbi:hypothetical protein GC093_00355 [Paenibacillus sp. LMG 31456]|uniref:Uncharacterized protein n=1 Tax=Paenibacillus foliorum TaxID=2654974 RepID=A0A972GJ11_9BACL|nr:hypothetical protein [Paenibacillus foliorum]NOU91691.1 hypothetical protein [Paenibacillus foliorum]